MIVLIPQVAQLVSYAKNLAQGREAHCENAQTSAGCNLIVQTDSTLSVTQVVYCVTTLYVELSIYPIICVCTDVQNIVFQGMVILHVCNTFATAGDVS